MTTKILAEMGYKGAPWFPIAVQHINDNNITNEKEIRDYIDTLIPKYIEFRDTPNGYATYINADNEVEEFNILRVKETMDEVMKVPTTLVGEVMPDACPAGPIGTIPVGGVVYAKDAIHPGMHSADICCSVMLTGFGTIAPKTVLDTIEKYTDFGAGPRKKPWFPAPKELQERMSKNKYFSEKAIKFAHSHLGTQGDGNHFAYVGISKNTGETCLITHHGSRGVGAEVYKAGMVVAEKWRKRLSPNTPAMNAWIPTTDTDGQEYWEALQLVREWTKLNHEILHNRVQEKLKYVSKTRFWNEHNFVFKMGNTGTYAHAKGATPMVNGIMADNDYGNRIIPLNMAEPILIVSSTSRLFAPHGAGRNLSRSQYFKSLTKTEEEVFAEETKGLDIRFYTGTPDMSELPGAYKNAQSVKAQIQKYDLANIVDEIIPYGTIMAGKSQFERRK